MTTHIFIDCIIAFCLPYLVVSEFITYKQNEKWKKEIEDKIYRILSK